MEVELDVFSGRPNPTWQLSPELASELSTKLRALSEKAQPAEEPGLGYRGFVLRDGNSTMKVFSGRVTIQSAGPQITYKDTSGIEKALVADARQRGYGNFL